MWVFKLCCHVKTELICIVNLLVTKNDLLNSCHFKHLFQQHWLKQGVYSFFNTLQYKSQTHSQSLSELLSKVMVIRFDNQQLGPKVDLLR